MPNVILIFHQIETKEKQIEFIYIPLSKLWLILMLISLLLLDFFRLKKLPEVSINHTNAIIFSTTSRLPLIRHRHFECCR